MTCSLFDIHYLCYTINLESYRSKIVFYSIELEEKGLNPLNLLICYSTKLNFSFLAFSLLNDG